MAACGGEAFGLRPLISSKEIPQIELRPDDRLWSPASMTWAKFDDGYDEETQTLSDRAFRLYTCAITYSRRRELGGVLAPKDTASLFYRLKASTKHAAELCAGEPEEALWLRDGENYLIRNYEKYNPLTSTERVRKHRSVKRIETFPSVSETPNETPMKRNGTPLARAAAPGLETTSTSLPVPVPVPVTPPLPPTSYPEALELQVGLSRVLGISQPKGKDYLTAERMWLDFHRRYEGVLDMVTTVEADVARRQREGREPIRSLEGCRVALRWTHDQRADATPAPRARSHVTSLEMNHVGDLLAFPTENLEVRP